jgi:hypothetical protein
MARGTFVARAPVCRPVISDLAAAFGGAPGTIDIRPRPPLKQAGKLGNRREKYD